MASRVIQAKKCMTMVQFGAENPQYLLVGVRREFAIQCFHPEYLIHIYEFSDDGKSFSLVNTTVVEDVPYTMCQVEDCILIGVGNLLCLYRFKQSTKALIRCTGQVSKTPIHAIWSRGNFFIVKTADEHITYGYLEAEEASLIMIHEDRYMRGVTCLCFWDDHVIFVAHKRSISAVFLPYYDGCEKPLTEADISELTERMDICDLGSSKLQPEESSPESGDLNFEVKPSFKIKLSAEETGLSPEPQAGPSHSVPKTKTKTSPSSSLLTQLDYCYPFARFLDNSYVLVTYEVRESVRSIQKTSLVEEGRDLIVYTTMSGMVGTLVPFLFETHHQMFGPLEHLISKANPFLSTDWLAPVNPNGKDIYEQCYDNQVVIDANVCELFNLLKRQDQFEIANELGISVLEVLQKIEEMKRTKYF